ncbi:MAG TPA: flagellar export chaperone FliS [Bryobacteraceae bacterium]|nr:flagellar export chaperone FliS [Bryobacteraceae bacterium]
MSYASRNVYVDNEILNASSERLVQILYGLAVQSIAAARNCLKTKDVPGRVAHINKAFAVLVELSSGLDFEAGGEIANNYARIYDYCQRRLIEANAKQSEAVLAEVQSLLEELHEAWQVVVKTVSAERVARLASSDILPSEEALAGNLNCLG